MAGGFANFDSCIINKKNASSEEWVKIYGSGDENGTGGGNGVVANELQQADCQKLN